MIILSRLIAIFTSFLLFVSIATTIFAIEKIDINTASLEQLDEIIGIGPALAQRIIETRPFSSVDDLIKVKGIGAKTLQEIKDQGLAYTGVSFTEDNRTEASPLQYLSNETPELNEIETPITYPSGIILNEILPSPEGSDADEEWIEIHNQNPFSVSLSDWKLEDSAGQTHVFVFSDNYEIAANGFTTLNRRTTKIVLNNDGDGLRLTQPDGTLVDQTSFEKALLGQSYILINDNWQWTSILTPGAENVFPIIPETESDQKKSEEPIDLRKSESASINEQVADVGGYSLLLFALLIAFFAGIVIFIAKKKLNFRKEIEIK